MQDKKATQAFMLNIVRQIALLDMETVDEIIDETGRSLDSWAAIGSIIDPTKYRDMLHSGAFDHSRFQLEAVKRLREIRQLVTEMDAIVKANQHE